MRGCPCCRVKEMEVCMEGEWDELLAGLGVWACHDDHAPRR